MASRISNVLKGNALYLYSNIVSKTCRFQISGDPTLVMARKLVHIIRSISSGDIFLIRPDGPEGPSYVVKPGLTFIAKKTGAAILPLGCYC